MGCTVSFFCWRKKHKNSKIPKFFSAKCSKIPKFASLLSFGRSFRVYCITNYHTFISNLVYPELPIIKMTSTHNVFPFC